MRTGKLGNGEIGAARGGVGVGLVVAGVRGGGAEIQAARDRNSTRRGQTRRERREESADSADGRHR